MKKIYLLLVAIIVVALVWVVARKKPEIIERPEIDKEYFETGAHLYKNADISPEKYEDCESLPPKKIDYMNINVAVVYYGINEVELAKLKKGIELARKFYWRNSGLKLNLSLVYIPINEIIGKNSNWDQTIEKAVNDAGYQIKDFGAIFHISTDVGGTWSWGVHGNFDVGFSHSVFPVPTGVVYPIDDPSVNYKITWIFVHEFQHALDEMYKRSGYPEMFQGDQPLAYAFKGGEQFSYQAEGLKKFNNWLGLSRKWGTINHLIDYDENGIPDNKPDLPIDDKRLGKGWNKKKYMAGIYQGRLTGSLYDICLEVEKFSPSIDGYIEAGWTFLTDKRTYDELHISSKIYSAWNKNNIYIAGVVNKPTNLHLWLDIDGDGWWHGRNNLEILFDIPTNRINLAHAMDCSNKTRKYQCTLGGPKLDDKLCLEMWDNNSNYPYEKIISPRDIEHSVKLTGRIYSFEIKIPANLKEGQEIGYRINFEKDNKRATIFEDYEFYYLPKKKIEPSKPLTSEDKAKAFYILAKNYRINNLSEQALEEYEKVIEKYPQTSWAEKASQRIKEKKAK